MPVFRDRVKDTSTTAGTGALTLSGTAPTGYQTFYSAFPLLNTPFLYCIVEGALWETGTGWLSASTTMERDTAVMDGSSGPGVLVTFTGASKDVFCTITSHWCEDVDSGAAYIKARGWALP